MSCSGVIGDQRFGVPCCLHLQGEYGLLYARDCQYVKHFKKRNYDSRQETTPVNEDSGLRTHGFVLNDPCYKPQEQQISPSVEIWVVTPCSDVLGYRRFGGPCCLTLQGE